MALLASRAGRGATAVAETGPTYGGLTPRDAGDMILRSLYWAFAVGHHGV